jgi:hypothetical protein
MTNDKPTRRRILVAGFVFFAAFIAGGALAPSQADRIAYSALQMGLALMCFGLVAWLAGRDIRSRDTFEWRGMTFRGSRVPWFGRGWMAFGVAYWALGLAVIALWIATRG